MCPASAFRGGHSSEQNKVPAPVSHTWVGQTENTQAALGSNQCHEEEGKGIKNDGGGRVRRLF